jgi:hypothetical protein
MANLDFVWFPIKRFQHEKPACALETKASPFYAELQLLRLRPTG